MNRKIKKRNANLQLKMVCSNKFAGQGWLVATRSIATLTIFHPQTMLKGHVMCIVKKSLKANVQWIRIFHVCTSFVRLSDIHRLTV